MPRFPYRIRPTRIDILPGGPTEGEARIVDEHVEVLKDLTRQGRVLLSGRTLTADGHTLGIVIFEAGSEAAAEPIIRLLWQAEYMLSGPANPD